MTKRGSIPSGGSVDVFQLFHQESEGTQVFIHQFPRVIGDGCYQGEVGWWGIKFPALSVHFVLHTGKVDTSGYRKPSTGMSWLEMEASVNV